MDTGTDAQNLYAAIWLAAGRAYLVGQLLTSAAKDGVLNSFAAAPTLCSNGRVARIGDSRCRVNLPGTLDWVGTLLGQPVRKSVWAGIWWFDDLVNPHRGSPGPGQGSDGVWRCDVDGHGRSVFRMAGDVIGAPCGSRIGALFCRRYARVYSGYHAGIWPVLVYGNRVGAVFLGRRLARDGAVFRAGRMVVRNFDRYVGADGGDVTRVAIGETGCWVRSLKPYHSVHQNDRLGLTFPHPFDFRFISADGDIKELERHLLGRCAHAIIFFESMMQSVRSWALGFTLLMAWLLLISAQTASDLSQHHQPVTAIQAGRNIPLPPTVFDGWWTDQAALYQAPGFQLLLTSLIGLAIAAGCHGLARRQTVGMFNFAIHALVAMGLIGSVGIGPLYSSLASVCCLLLLFYVIILERNVQLPLGYQKHWHLPDQLTPRSQAQAQGGTSNRLYRILSWGLFLMVVALWSNLHHGALLGCVIVWIFGFSRVISMKNSQESGEEAKRLKQNAIAVSLVTLIGTVIAPGGFFHPLEMAQQIYQGLPLERTVETAWAFENPVAIVLFITTLGMAGWSFYQAARWPLFESLSVLLLALFAMVQIEWLPLYLVIWLVWIPPLWNQRRSWFSFDDLLQRWHPQFISVAVTTGLVMAGLLLNIQAEILTIPSADRGLSQQTDTEHPNSTGQDGKNLNTSTRQPDRPSPRGSIRRVSNAHPST